MKHVSLPIASVCTLIISIVTGVGAYYGALGSQQQALAAVKTDVAVLQNISAVHDSEINAINSNLKNMNDNIVKLLVHNGIQPSNN